MSDEETTYGELAVEETDDVVFLRRVAYTSLDEDLIEAVKLEVGDSRFDDYVPHYLEVAKQAIVARLWPYRDDMDWDNVPKKHWPVAVQIAAYLVNKRGAEGETSHSESGTSRTYESAGIPASFLRSIVPRVGVPS